MSAWADAVARAWTSWYTRGADAEVAERREAEIRSDLFEHAPRRVVGQHSPHDAKPQRTRARCQRRDQQMGRRAVTGTEMMLAEKDAFEAKCLVKDPQIEIAREQCCHIVRIRLYAWAAQLRQEFK